MRAVEAENSARSTRCQYQPGEPSRSSSALGALVEGPIPPGPEAERRHSEYGPVRAVRAGTLRARATQGRALAVAVGDVTAPLRVMVQLGTEILALQNRSLSTADHLAAVSREIRQSMVTSVELAKIMSARLAEPGLARCRMVLAPAEHHRRGASVVSAGMAPRQEYPRPAIRRRLGAGALVAAGRAQLIRLRPRVVAMEWTDTAWCSGSHRTRK
jgi:hypothetical protein